MQQFLFGLNAAGRRRRCWPAAGEQIAAGWISQYNLISRYDAGSLAGCRSLHVIREALIAPPRCRHPFSPGHRDTNMAPTTGRQ